MLNSTLTTQDNEYAGVEVENNEHNVSISVGKSVRLSNGWTPLVLNLPENVRPKTDKWAIFGYEQSGNTTSLTAKMTASGDLYVYGLATTSDVLVYGNMSYLV